MERFHLIISRAGWANAKAFLGQIGGLVKLAVTWLIGGLLSCSVLLMRLCNRNTSQLSMLHDRRVACSDSIDYLTAEPLKDTLPLLVDLRTSNQISIALSLKPYWTDMPGSKSKEKQRIMPNGTIGNILKWTPSCTISVFMSGRDLLILLGSVWCTERECKTILASEMHCTGIYLLQSLISGNPASEEGLKAKKTRCYGLLFWLSTCFSSCSVGTQLPSTLCVSAWTAAYTLHTSKVLALWK